MILLCDISRKNPIEFYMLDGKEHIYYESREVFSFPEKFRNIYQSGKLLNKLFNQGVTAWALIEVLED